MKLQKRLTVAGTEVGLVSEDIRLDMGMPGRAVFQVRATEQLQGEVAFALGWHWDATLTLFFTGEVERCTTVDGSQQRLFCRELTARLDAHHPLALRHPTLREVLAAYAARTRLRFIVPDKSYADTRVPYFGNVGPGFHGMTKLGDVFSVPDYIWQAQGDGQVFVGSWDDSRWKGREVTMPEEAFGQATANGARTLAAIPGLRPGALLNGKRVTALRLCGHEMEVTCAKQ